MKQEIHPPTKEQLENFEKGLSVNKNTKTMEFELPVKEVEDWLMGIFNKKETELLRFEGVLEAFRQHKPISRVSKSEEYLFIYYQIPAKIDLSVVPKMTSVPNGVKEIMGQLQKGFNYQNQAVKVDKDGYVTYWNPSIEDIEAEDWYIVEV